MLDSLCLRPPEPSLWKCFYFNSSCLGHLKTENREASLCRPRCLLCGEIHIVTRYNLEMRAFPYKVMITVQRCGSKQLTQAVDAFCLWVKGAYQEPIVTFLFLSDWFVGDGSNLWLYISFPAPGLFGFQICFVWVFAMQTCFKLPLFLGTPLGGRHVFIPRPQTLGGKSFLVMFQIVIFSLFFLYLILYSLSLYYFIGSSSVCWHSVSCFSGTSIIKPLNDHLLVTVFFF